MNKLTWPTVGLIAVLLLGAIALATLAHWDSDQILAVIGVLGGLGGGAAVAGGVGGRVEEVAKRLNGELDGRIVAAVRQGNAEQLSAIVNELNAGR
jgi:hypothetical protein